MGKALISPDGDPAQLGLELAMFAAHYMGIIEGVMAVTGYDFFDDLLATTGMFPRLHEGIRQIRIDEGRHIVHGLDYLREMIAAHPEYAPPVRELFMQQAMTIPARTEFIFTPNAFGLDQDKMLRIGYAHIEQRMKEAGLA
jgi:ribonucleoside-diphosphate reductase beta chain